jgi:hypothetical protein
MSLPFVSASVLLLLAAAGPNQSGGEEQAFRLGAAMREQCASAPAPAPFCADLHDFLGKLAGEPRDARWAGDMEARLRKFLLVDGKPWAELRSLECRRTRCAMEFATSLATAGEDIKGDGFDELLELMEPASGGMAYELPGANTPPKVVTVMCWQRQVTPAR